MRSIFKGVLALVILLLSVGTAGAIEIDQLIQDINPDKTTSAYRKVFWQDMEGKKVRWSGELYEVRGGFRDVYKVFALVGKPKAGKYNVIMTVASQPEIAKLKKGTTIHFTGALHKYKWSKPRPVKLNDGSIDYIRKFVIYIEDAHIDLDTSK